MKSYDTSLAPLESREDGFVKILEQALDPYLEGCDDLALKLSKVDQNIFCLNCLLAAQSTLEPFDFTVQRVGSLQERISRCVEGLTDHRHRWFLEESGLCILLNALSEWQTEAGHSELRAPFTPESLQEASQKLDDFLPSALMDARAAFNRLNSPKLLDEIIQKAAEEFTHDFARAEEAIFDNMSDVVEGGSEGVRILFPRTVDEVTVLLN